MVNLIIMDILLWIIWWIQFDFLLGTYRLETRRRIKDVFMMNVVVCVGKKFENLYGRLILSLCICTQYQSLIQEAQHGFRY